MSWSTMPARMLESLFEVKDRVAVITGGASGIGATSAELFTAMGMKVYIFDFNEQAGKAREKYINACGYSGTFQFVKLDVTKPEDCINAVQTTFAVNNNRFDILYNCAGISKRDVHLQTEADRERLWAVNVDGTVNMCNAAVKAMKENDFGRIINMGSAVAMPGIAFPDGLLYKRSKDEIHRFTRELALLHARDGITVNALAPARVITPMVTGSGQGWVDKAENPIEAFRGGCATQATGLMLKPEEVAFKALSLCSPLSANITGTIVDMTSAWAIGHSPYSTDEMPAAFDEFRTWAQQRTATNITPLE